MIRASSPLPGIASPSSAVRPLVFVAFWTLLAVGLQAYLWLARPVGVPANPPRRGGILALPRDPGNARLSQTFRLDADGFDTITLYPLVNASSASSTPTARVDITLSDVTSHAAPRLLFQATASARDLRASDPYVLRFPPIVPSARRVFQLDLAIVDSGPDAPIAFASVSDNTFRDGTLLIDGRPEWGDLAFSTGATQDTAFRRFTALTLPAGWPRSEGFWVGVLLLYDVACAALFWRLIAARQRPQPASYEPAA